MSLLRYNLHTISFGPLSAIWPVLGALFLKNYLHIIDGTSTNAIGSSDSVSNGLVFLNGIKTLEMLESTELCIVPQVTGDSTNGTLDLARQKGDGGNDLSQQSIAF